FRCFRLRIHREERFTLHHLPVLKSPDNWKKCTAPLSGQKKKHPEWGAEIDDKPPGSFRKKSARGCMFMVNKQITEIRFGKLGGSQSLFLSSRGARPFF